MDNQLLATIHKYAEDREIDWTSAKVIGEQYGKIFKSEDDLREWKYIIDNYLKTFSADAFQKIEEACKGKKKNKKKATTETKQVDEAKTKPHDPSERAQKHKRGMKPKSLYTKAQLSKLKDYYGVSSNEKALEKAIADKEKGTNPLEMTKKNKNRKSMKESNLDSMFSRLDEKWSVEKREDQWAVVKEDGKIESYHDTKKEARDHQKALYANYKK